MKFKLTKLNQKSVNLVATDDGYTEPTYEDVKDA